MSPILLNSVCYSDTAGLREAQDPVEKEGVWRALKRQGAAISRLVETHAELSLFSFVGQKWLT